MTTFEVKQATSQAPGPALAARLPIPRDDRQPDNNYGHAGGDSGYRSGNRSVGHAGRDSGDRRTDPNYDHDGRDTGDRRRERSSGHIDADSALIVELAQLAAQRRQIESAMITVIGDIATKSDDVGTDESLAFRHGFRSTVKLVEGIVGCKSQTAFKLVAAARASQWTQSLTGQPIEPAFPEVSAAVLRGELSAESATAIISILGPSRSRAKVEDFAAAERGLIALATGISHPANDTSSHEANSADDAADAAADAANDVAVEESAEDAWAQLVMPADLVEHAARVWRDRIDPDGVEPRADEAHRRRGLRVSRRPIAGLHRVSGAIPTDLAARFHAQLDTLAARAHRTDPASVEARASDPDSAALRELSPSSLPVDTRTRDQLGADLFAAMLTACATSDTFASPPAVLVTIQSAGDDESVPVTGLVESHSVARSVIDQMACDAGTQEVTLTPAGRILSLSTAGRFFTASQRRAIAARDGHTCLVPTCSIPATACEAHHVQPAALGGKTHVDNGVLLCWAHHRMLDNGSWEVTISHGIPRVTHLPRIPALARTRNFPLRT